MQILRRVSHDRRRRSRGRVHRAITLPPDQGARRAGLARRLGGDGARRLRRAGRQWPGERAGRCLAQRRPRVSCDAEGWDDQARREPAFRAAVRRWADRARAARRRHQRDPGPDRQLGRGREPPARGRLTRWRRRRALRPDAARVVAQRPDGWSATATRSALPRRSPSSTGPRPPTTARAAPSRTTLTRSWRVCRPSAAMPASSTLPADQGDALPTTHGAAHHEAHPNVLPDAVPPQAKRPRGAPAGPPRGRRQRPTSCPKTPRPNRRRAPTSRTSHRAWHPAWSSPGRTSARRMLLPLPARSPTRRRRPTAPRRPRSPGPRPGAARAPRRRPRARGRPRGARRGPAGSPR